MRIAYLLTPTLLAVGAPALTQTVQPTPTPTPSAMPSSAPGAQTGATPNAGSTAPAMQNGETSAAAQTTVPASTTPIPPTVGATVYGAAGTPVGTIKAMDSQFVTLVTPKGEVRLPAAGVGPGLKGPVIGLTAEQLDAAVAQAQAAQPAAATATAGKSTTTTTPTRSKTKKAKGR